MFGIDEECGKIVLGCERADRVRVAPVVEQLSALGYGVELASGLDVAERPLIDAIERLGSNAVYLLLGGAHSPRPVVDRWRRIVGEAGVPAEQIWMGDARFIGPSDLMRNAFEMAEGLRSQDSDERTKETPIVAQGPRASRPELAPPRPELSGAPAVLPAVDGFERWRVPIAVGLTVSGLLFSVSLAVAWWGSSGSDEASKEVEERPISAAIATHEDADDPGDERPGREPEEPADAAEPPSEPSGEPEGESPDAIDRALARRDFRAIDVLLVAPAAREDEGDEGPATMTNFTDAQAYCESLEIAGVTGWNLPTVGELVSLQRGGMLGGGTYWSKTSGDVHGDSHMVWNQRKKRWKAVGSWWHYGNIVCVRRRVPGAAANG